MIDSFKVLNSIFEWCTKDEELCSLLKIDNSLDGNKLLNLQNVKLRREYQTSDVIDNKEVPFISFYFLHSEKNKKNWLVNKGDLVVDIYAKSTYDIQCIVRRFRKVISGNMEILLNYEGQHYSGVIGVYKYRLIYNPLIDGE